MENKILLLIIQFILFYLYFYIYESFNNYLWFYFKNDLYFIFIFIYMSHLIFITSLWNFLINYFKVLF